MKELVGYLLGSLVVLVGLGIALAFLLFPSPPPMVNEFDFGDAPDPSFPSLLASDGAHIQDITQFWLGDLEEPSADTEADSHQVDQDAFDDGLESFTLEAMSGSPRLIGSVALSWGLATSNSATPATVYFNLLIDVNGDGQWQGDEEWVVMNQEVDLTKGEIVGIDADFVVLFVVQNEGVWVRAALTDTPVSEDNFPDGWDGTGQFKMGEIEDYLISVNPEETPTPTETPTSTPTPTYTPSAPPFPTDTPTATPTFTPIMIPTFTTTPTLTPMPTPTRTRTIPRNSPTPTPQIR